ncbi:MAG: hypothetical protein WC710_11465 [Gallionella sp.]|jgi:hypothetical protein
MSLKTDIDQLVVDAALIHTWSQGDAATSVTMGGAAVRSPAKLIADKDAEINAAADGVLAQATSQANTATTQAEIAAAKALLTAEDVVLTHADVLTTADQAAIATAKAVLTAADVASTHADASTTGANAAAVAAQTTLAITKAAEAAASSTSALAGAGAASWVSGSYNIGAVVWSPINLLTYRAKTTGAKPTDPANDPTNWTPIIPLVTNYSVAMNDIGVAGAAGFGVGICPQPPFGMYPLSNATFNPYSDDYGNYQYSDGSVMVWVPAFFYKWGTGANGLAINIVDVKPFSFYANVAAANTAGYALHRAFYDGGNIQPGVFVDKYKCSNNNGTASSIRGGNPVSTAAANNPIGSLTGAPANTYYGVIAAAKTRGANFFPGSLFVNKAVALLALAHAQASTSTTWCAWYHATNNFPKGCNNNALGDANDAAILYVSAGNVTYPTAPKTGSANQFAKTTHNGQNCGIADLNGVIYEICIGLTTQIPTSTAAGYTSDATGFAIGTTSIPLITGTGTVVAGDMITFAGDTNQYAVTTGIAAPGTIVIAAPGLKVAIPAAATAVSIVPASYYLPKTSVAMKNLTSGRTVSTDAWGSPALSANFDNLGTTYGALWATGANRATPIGSASQVFDAATSGNAWAATGAGLPLAAGVGGTNAFGNDYLYDYKPNDLCPLAAFYWGNGAPAGVWALNLTNVRGDSSYHVGFRAALYL